MINNVSEYYSSMISEDLCSLDKDIKKILKQDPVKTHKVELSEIYFSIGRLQYFIKRIKNKQELYNNYSLEFNMLISKFLIIFKENYYEFMSLLKKEMDRRINDYNIYLNVFKKDYELGILIKTDFEEINQFILFDRDYNEYVMNGIEFLNHQYNIVHYEVVLEGWRNIDSMLSLLLPKFCSIYVKEGWKFQDSVYYPEHFWWRKLAWNVYIQSHKDFPNKRV